MVTDAYPQVATFYKKETTKPAGAEEDIESLIINLQEEEHKITTYANRGDKNKNTRSSSGVIT